MYLVMAVTVQQRPVGIPVVAVVPVQVMHFEHVGGQEAESALRTLAVLSLEQGRHAFGQLWVAAQTGGPIRDR
jgi:hypothetical protein